MNDYLVRGMTMDGFVKVVAIRSTEMVRRGAEIQGTTPNATAAFGRALTAASMMGNMQKVENGSMTLQIRGANGNDLHEAVHAHASYKIITPLILPFLAFI